MSIFDDMDYSKLTEDELDEKIQDVLAKVEACYKMGHGAALDQLLFHLDSLKLELGDKLEKQRFELIQGRTPDTLTITDDDEEEEELPKK
jgi:hypothetical protein|tara:strand:- start:2351 stop:2620 length:270 start_codon:yes stop_codon:yes gene_type:complete